MLQTTIIGTAVLVLYCNANIQFNAAQNYLRISHCGTTLNSNVLTPTGSYTSADYTYT
jgi:hypothetical protein